MKKCILLVRASTITQTVEDQTKELEAWAKKEGYKKDKQRIVIANNESGYKLKEEERLGLNRMKYELEHDADIDCVYAWSVSRIGRNDKVNASIKNYLIERKIQLKTHVEHLVLLDKNKELDKGAEYVFAIFSTNAKQGAQEIKENTLRGKIRAMTEGKSAHGKLLYGYKKGDNGVIEEDVEKAKIIRYIFDEYVEKEVAVVNIYRELVDKGLFNESTTERSGIARIRDILKNPSYCGEPHFKKLKVEVDGKLVEKKRDLTEAKRYPALVTKERFEAAKARLKERISEPKVNTKYVYYAKGLIRFMGLEKPHRMVANRQTITYRVPDQLHRFSISINAIDSILWEAATHLYSQMLSNNNEAEVEQLHQLRKDNVLKIETAKKRIKELKETDKRAYAAYLHEVSSLEELDESRSKIMAQIDEQIQKITKLEGQNDRISRQIRQLGSDEWKIVDVTKIQGISDDAERKRIIDKVIDSIDIYPLKEGDGCEIIIEQHINILGYAHTYTYKSRGGKITLIRRTQRISGEVITKDISDTIVKRFERNDSKGDRHKNRKKVVRTPTVDADVSNP